MKTYSVLLLEKDKDEDDADGFGGEFSGKSWKEILKQLKEDYPDYKVVDHWEI